MGVNPDNDLQESGCVLHCTCQGTDGVLVFANRDNKMPRREADGRLYADDVVPRTGYYDATACLDQAQKSKKVFYLLPPFFTRKKEVPNTSEKPSINRYR